MRHIQQDMSYTLEKPDLHTSLWGIDIHIFRHEGKNLVCMMHSQSYFLLHMSCTVENMSHMYYLESQRNLQYRR